MCVIFVVEDTRPTAGMVEAAYHSNPEGAGIAWREDNQVKWEKGLDLEEIIERVANVPFPFVAHFRISSVGGPSRLLNHPFPIQKDAPLIMNGTSEGPVLFHNGHWNKWRETLLDLAAKGGWKLPGDKYSDSRAMAILAANMGLGVLELLDEKIVAFGPDLLEFYGTGWSVYNTDYPFICSNRHWDTGLTSAHGWRPTKAGGRTIGGGTTSCDVTYLKPPASMLPAVIGPRQVTGGPADQDTFCGGVHVRPENVGGNRHTATEPTNRERQISAAQEVIRASKQRSEAARSGTGTSQGVAGEAGHNPALIHAPSQQDIEKVKWVRSLNPSRYKGQGGGSSDDILAKRREDYKKGIERIGPMS